MAMNPPTPPGATPPGSTPPGAPPARQTTPPSQPLPATGAVAPPAGPPTVGAAVPPTYFDQPGTSAYYQPAAGTGAPPARRTTRNLLIAAGAALVAVAAAGGIVFAVVHKGPSQSSTTPAGPGPIAPVSTPIPSAPPSSQPTAQPTAQPTLQPTAQPTVAPSGSPGPGPSGSTDVGFATFTLPSSGLSFNQQASNNTFAEIDVTDSTYKGGDEFSLHADAPPQGVSDLNSLMQWQLANDQQLFPGAKWCTPQQGQSNPAPIQLAGDSGPISGSGGVICGTVTPQSGQAYAFIDEIDAAYVSGPNGPKAIWFELFASRADYSGVVTQYGQALYRSVTWKGFSS